MAYSFSTLDYSLSGVTQSTFLTGIYGTSIVGMYVDANKVDHGLLYDLATQQWVGIADPLGESTVPYGPSSGSYASGITIVGSYKLAGQPNDHGFVFDSAMAPGFQYTTIYYPSAVNTIPHSTYNGLVVGNWDNTPTANPDYEMYPVSGNAFIYNIATQTFIVNDKPSAASTTAYGIWNGVIAGGYTDPSSGGVSLVHGYLYAMATDTWTSYDHPGGAIVTHFDGITGGSTAGSYILTGDWVSAADPTTPMAFVATITNGVATNWTDLSVPGAALTSGNSGYGNIAVGVYTTSGDSLVHGYVATDTVACFATGTRILTARGPVPVEQLAIGEMVPTQRGDMRPIIWIGHRKMDCARHPRPWDVQPVRIRAGALGELLPQHDLLLSPDHSIYVSDVLVPVRYLVDEVTIIQEQAEQVTYWHVELDSHEIIFAEGLPTESYLDTGNRADFGNAPVTTLHTRPFLRDQEAWAERAVGPLVESGPIVEAVRRRLAEHAGSLAKPAKILTITAPGLLRATLPAGVERVKLVSSCLHPAGERRRLGAAISGISIDGAPVMLGSSCFAFGFHEVESGWRWTNGEGVLRLEPADAPRVIEITVAMLARPEADAA